ncbi:hypothetical protein JTE90_007295 [Oedothorax gibbosus]|uniref:Uncharacterized protein n=1 Tax=Oedothorax gibbosus TaxID=931172 RepID=A0AAV6TIW2_9ARAC|nr:hypothetical protein JTE90_007295 [Oedothorax gibbosus]
MAYVLDNSARDVSRLFYLPKECVLPKTSEKVVLGVYDAKLDYESLYETVKYAIDEGRAYPEESIDKELFRFSRTPNPNSVFSKSCTVATFASEGPPYGKGSFF